MKDLSRMGYAVVLSAVGMVGIAGSPQPALADWDPGEPYKMHYPQLPDLTPNGMDVLASHWQPGTNLFKLLADDFQCTQTGPITDIHIWGSWLNDRLPLVPDAAGVLVPDPAGVRFKLSIHEDIPAGPNQPYSKPGAELWSAIFGPSDFTVRPYHTLPPTVAGEAFYDPNTGQILGFDHVIWQYNFESIKNPFIQTQGTIYWLDVQAQTAWPDARFGWKTTDPTVTPHFNDDAVYGDTIGFNGALVDPPGWQELIYPANHPYAGQSIDLAFVIAPEPGSAMLGIGLAGLVMLRRRR
ncbi:hypothetical protein [Fontivita pretiosa]|uniref:DUF7901 domain-containing protein n=1 Tax=Fontivita pretiosa TaxID=2989684 RepID=UPI003D17EE74